MQDNETATSKLEKSETETTKSGPATEEKAPTKTPTAPRTKIFFALPAYGGLCYAHFTQSLLAATHLLDEKGIEWATEWCLSESLVQRARNYLVDRFLASDATHLMFIDVDLQWSGEDLLGMLEADVDVICGAYPVKGIEWQQVADAVRRGEHPEAYAARYAVNPAWDSANEVKVNPDGSKTLTWNTHNGTCIPVLDAATGFLLVKKEVFWKMATPEWLHYSDLPQTRGRPMLSFFDCAIRDGRYLSEDYLFSRRWQDIGGTVWLYVPAKLRHIGMYAYAGDLLKQVIPGGERRLPEFPSGFEVAPSMKGDMGARQDLLGIFGGSYDLPIENVKTVLDIGGNVGAFCCWAATRWPDSVIVSYEPHPEGARQIRRNVDALALQSRIHIAECAVRDFEGESEMLEGTTYDGRSSLACNSFFNRGFNTRGPKIKVRCMDALKLPPADVVKCDSEGCEVEIFRRYDLSETKAVVYEAHSDGDRIVLESLMKACGFVQHSEAREETGGWTVKWIRPGAESATAKEAAE